MMLSVLAALLQPYAPAQGQQPVRVWLDPAGTVAPGTPVRVYVALAEPGQLLALRVTAYGRIDVLFPRAPTEGTGVEAGTYELRPAADAPTFVAAEPEGSGVVLAALAPLPYRFDEFSRGGAWEPTALAASWSGADPQDALLDIVQRMQGDGHFNYDVVSYVVARPQTPDRVADEAATGGYGYDYGVGYGGATVIVVPFVPWAFCDPFFPDCHELPLACRGGVHTAACVSGCFPYCGGVTGRTRAVAYDRRTPPVPPAAPPPAAIPPRRRPPPDYTLSESQALRPPSPLRETGTGGAVRAVPLARGSYVAPAPRRVNVQSRRVIRPPSATESSSARAAPLPVKVAWPRSGARPVVGAGPTAAASGLVRRTGVTAASQSPARSAAASAATAPAQAGRPGARVGAVPAKGGSAGVEAATRRHAPTRGVAPAPAGAAGHARAATPRSAPATGGARAAPARAAGRP